MIGQTSAYAHDGESRPESALLANFSMFSPNPGWGGFPPHKVRAQSRSTYTMHYIPTHASVVGPTKQASQNNLTHWTIGTQLSNNNITNVTVKTHPVYLFPSEWRDIKFGIFPNTQTPWERSFRVGQVVLVPEFSYPAHLSEWPEKSPRSSSREMVWSKLEYPEVYSFFFLHKTIHFLSTFLGQCSFQVVDLFANLASIHMPSCRCTYV